MPQKMEPLPAPEQPTVRVCRPLNGRVQGDPFSHRPSVTRAVANAVGGAACPTVDNCSRMTSSIRSVPGDTITDRAECAPAASRIAGTARSKSSTVCPILARTVNRRVVRDTFVSNSFGWNQRVDVTCLPSLLRRVTCSEADKPQRLQSFCHDTCAQNRQRSSRAGVANRSSYVSGECSRQ